MALGEAKGGESSRTANLDLTVDELPRVVEPVGDHHVADKRVEPIGDRCVLSGCASRTREHSSALALSISPHHHQDQREREKRIPRVTVTHARRDNRASTPSVVPFSLVK